jgi:hypothetical protein
MRTKQTYVLGRINPEDKSPAIRQIEKQANIDLSKMPLRTWFFNGETFISPNWIQSAKPHICNREVKARFNNYNPKQQQKKKAGFWKTLMMLPLAVLTAGNSEQQQPTTETDKEQLEEDNEDSQADGIFTDNSETDSLFPEEDFPE